MTSEELTCFHAITDWDTASTSAGRGENSSVENFFKLINAFFNLASAPLRILWKPSRDLWYSCMTYPAHFLR